MKNKSRPTDAPTTAPATRSARWMQALRDAYAPPVVETVMLSSVGALYASVITCMPIC
ncbi:MAG: hypothetical protein NVS3B20_12880 [Polyangiales bacterium]